eukprot:15392633-Alexandrium_andersonii.AAC.1
MDDSMPPTNSPTNLASGGARNHTCLLPCGAWPFDNNFCAYPRRHDCTLVTTATQKATSANEGAKASFAHQFVSMLKVARLSGAIGKG